MSATVGILALQGGFQDHYDSITALGAQACFVRTSEELETCDALILPGGESTAMLKLLKNFGLFEPLQKRLSEGLPCFGTCAGMILLAEQIAESDQDSFGILPVTVQRNAYGSQVHSFETTLKGEPETALAGKDLPAVFIRAPQILSFSKDVQILCVHEELPVLVQYKNLLAASFHPELTNNSVIHQYFLDCI